VPKGEQYPLRRFHAMSGIGHLSAFWAALFGTPLVMVSRFRKAIERLPSMFRSVRSKPAELRRGTGKRGERKRDRLSQGPAFAFKGTLPYPQFIIIGAPKCGTSWLRGTLDQHPDILVVPDEVEYFSDFLDRPVEWYLNHFAALLAAAPKPRSTPYVIGEKSARYCAIPLEQIRLVKRLLPDARLILMIRDPVTRHWAHAKRYFQKERFDKHGGGVMGVPRNELFDYFVRMRRLSEFSQMIANWTAVFPREQLLIVSQEHTLSAPRETYDAALDHIGASRDYDPAAIGMLNMQKNRGPSVQMPDDVTEFLEDMFASERSHLSALLGQEAYLHGRD
jgi:sulfotransferase family protein